MNHSIINLHSRINLKKDSFKEKNKKDNEPNRMIENPSKLKKKQKKNRKRKQKRCASENCRIKLSSIDLLRACKCKLIFCSSHRNPYDHDCNFDYKHHNQQILQGNNPTVKSTKITKI